MGAVSLIHTKGFFEIFYLEPKIQHFVNEMPENRL